MPKLFRSRPRPHLVCMALVYVLSVTSDTQAAEDELAIYAQPTGEMWLAKDPDFRFGGHFGVILGLSANASLIIDLSTNFGSLSPQWNTEVQAGMNLAIDVLRTIPFLEVLSGFQYGGARIHSLLSLGLGADYLLTPKWSLGLVGRIKPLHGSDTQSLGSQLGLRFCWRTEL